MGCSILKWIIFFASLCESGIVKAHHEGWARKATQEVFELERAVEVR